MKFQIHKIKALKLSLSIKNILMDQIRQFKVHVVILYMPCKRMIIPWTTILPKGKFSEKPFIPNMDPWSNGFIPKAEPFSVLRPLCTVGFMSSSSPDIEPGSFQSPWPSNAPKTRNKTKLKQKIIFSLKHLKIFSF